MPDEATEITPLRRAVNWLIAKEEITSEGDLGEKMGLSKSTISGYLSGKPSKEFIPNLEKKFNIKIKDFEQSFKDFDFVVQKNDNVLIFEIKSSLQDDHEPSEIAEPLPRYGNNQNSSSEAVLKLANANELLSQSNKTLADNNKELIELVKVTVNDQKEIPPAFASRMGNLLEVISGIVSDGKKLNKYEVAALVNKVLHGETQQNVSAGTQKDSDTQHN